MKKLVLTLTALTTLSIIAACGKSKKDDDAPTPSKHALEVKAFEENYNRWQVIKPNYKTYSYSYLVISDAKKWDYVTYVDVVDNAVACRSVKTKGVLSWAEKADQVNSHEDAPKAYLLDDVYKNCLTLKDNPNVKFFYQNIGTDSILRGCNLGCLEKDCTLNDVAIYKISLTDSYCSAE
jgi:hypothetical protein